MAINGILVGASGTFQADPVPSTIPFPSGTINTWSCDDPSISIAPSSDGTQLVATVPTGSTTASFNLTVSAQMPGASAPLTNTVNVPILQPAPVPTGVVINQIS